MLRIPKRFFFIMDAHQAAVTFALFGMGISTVMVLMVGELYHLVGSGSHIMDELIKELADDEAKTLITGLPKIVWSFVAVCLLVLAVESTMLVGVLKRKRWLLVPWLVLEAMELIGIVAEVFFAYEHPTVISVLCGMLLFVFQLGMSLYGILSVYACYTLLGPNSEPPSFPFENQLDV